MRKSMCSVIFLIGASALDFYMYRHLYLLYLYGKYFSLLVITLLIAMTALAWFNALYTLLFAMRAKACRDNDSNK